MSRHLIGLMVTALAVVILTASVFSQAPDTLWSRIYTPHSAALSLHEMPDSGFVLGGYIVPDGEVYRDMFIVRTNSTGDTVWTSAIGESGRHESASCLYPAVDGGFILAGNRGEDAPYSSYSDVYLVKTDHLGAFAWHSVFGEALESESSISVVPTFDRGYLIAGYFWDSPTGYDIWLLKTDSLGILMWPDHLTWADADYPTCIGLTADSGFAITGYSQSFDAEYDYDMFLLRLNRLGGETWSGAYGSVHPWDEAANHICHTSDGGYLLCGYRKDDTTPKDIYVVKVDGSFDVEWTSQLGGTYHDEARCCIETVDGGYAVSASWYRDGNWQVGLIKYDAEGDTMWTAFYGDSAHGHTPYGLVQTADNGYAVGGLRSGDTSAAFLVKFAGTPDEEPYTFRATDRSVPVDDISVAADTITISIAPPGSGDRRVVGVRLMIDSLEHPAVEELAVTIAHEGTEVTLLAEGDCIGSGFTGTVFTDASAAFLSGGQAPYTGIFRPRELLGAFDYHDPNGDWVLRMTDGAPGNDGILRAWGITLLTDIALDVGDEGDNGLPVDYYLSQSYPNPFNPSATIRYSLPQRAEVTIEIFNILGQKVITLVDEPRAAGTYEITWNGDDSAGDEVAAGVYFYRFQANDFVETKKMVLLK